MPYRSHLRAMGSMAGLGAFARCFPPRERALACTEVAHG
jgi:hypothetical protein